MGLISNNKQKKWIDVLRGSIRCLLKAFTYMNKRETCYTDLEGNGELFLKCDELWTSVPSIFESSDESLKNMFVYPMLSVYVLRMATEELTNPGNTRESRIMEWSFVIVSLCVIENSKGSCNDRGCGSLDDKIFFCKVLLLICSHCHCHCCQWSWWIVINELINSSWPCVRVSPVRKLFQAPIETYNTWSGSIALG